MKNYGFSTYFKFIGLSLFGILLFFTPVTVNGSSSIPLDHLITLINQTLPGLGPGFTLCIAIIGGILPWFDKTYKKGTAAFVISIFRTLGAPVALLAFVNAGPAWLLQKDMLPFVWEKIVVAVTVIVAIGSIFLTFIISYGFLEFVGVIMKPVLRPIFKVPGMAAVDADLLNQQALQRRQIQQQGSCNHHNRFFNRLGHLHDSNCENRRFYGHLELLLFFHTGDYILRYRPGSSNVAYKQIR
jgi:hypothetical protein